MKVIQLAGCCRHSSVFSRPFIIENIDSHREERLKERAVGYRQSPASTGNITSRSNPSAIGVTPVFSVRLVARSGRLSGCSLPPRRRVPAQKRNSASAGGCVASQAVPLAYWEGGKSL